MKSCRLGQFWAKEKVQHSMPAMIINNLTLLPDARHAGKSLVEVFGASWRLP